jgi:antitoxin (DNA-binding transcriptional repressor) of toxin-antitoxin stability system
MGQEHHMSQIMSIEQASAHLGQLVRSLAPGDEIVLTDDDKPVARIVSDSPRKPRTPGAWKGLLTIVSDDDEHLKDFKDYMP